MNLLYEGESTKSRFEGQVIIDLVRGSEAKVEELETRESSKSRPWLSDI